MRKNINVTLFSLALILASCAGSSDLNTEVSNTTGWVYNDTRTTGFEVVKAKKDAIPNGMVPIQGGSFTIGEKGEYTTAPRQNQHRNITVSSFYMDRYEVTNLDWREYVNWMTLVFANVAPELVQRVMPDQTVWREELAYNEPYIQNYFQHPAFNFYPVVGVTWEQAMDYCVWRTDRVNEMALVRARIIEAPDFKQLDAASGLSFDAIVNDFIFNTDKYLLSENYNPNVGKKPKTTLTGNPRKSTVADGILMASFRLPTEVEWEFAAYAPVAGPEGYTIEGKMYPWSGYQTRNANKKQKGMQQANFIRGKGDMMGVSGALNDGYVFSAPVNSFSPNDFGLYNMAGNVNEWVLDVYRETSLTAVSEYNSFRGNVVYQPVLDGAGGYLVDSLGRIKTKIVDDLRSYKDGDLQSTIDTDYVLYYDSVGMANLANAKVDPTDILAPRYTDKTRVYKGGSWKDRIYWLNPSTRRYLDQDKCSSTIGFRCAMSTVGTELPTNMPR